MPKCERGRGCTCEEHTKRREYARKRYAEKYKGIPRKRASPGTAASLTTRRKPIPPGNEPRFMEGRVEEEVVIHWMPKAAEEWECPQCGEWFLLVDGKWTQPWVA